MYIIYISKAEREKGVVLENTRKEALEGKVCDAQNAMKKIRGAYFRQREVSAQKATYRACGLHLRESQRKAQFLPVDDNQVKMSLHLNIIQMKANQSDDSIWMHSLYDRYKARPVNLQFDILCYASFSSEYNILSASQYVFKLQDNHADGLPRVSRPSRPANYTLGKKFYEGEIFIEVSHVRR
ncbi:unnamed protein product [Mytilus edulis]|uniref:Uncharacterized protein n=1 Tax=Mytilus edulis TaxID=6550 RepID=A0A8S3REY4_MYTED|nr:unnamed protein product [Mytilus edulis]